MADIAMLVAEEYERRVKSSIKNGGDGDEINLFSFVSVLAERIDGFSLMKNNFGEESMRMVKRVLEPRSLMGLEAMNGSFPP